jgi:glycosyltransferase involved in cell wall biosynthesis
MPSVTVLMPVYNAERYVRVAIESILAQTHTDFELLIINDGSTDSSRKIIESCRDPRIRFVENEQNMGLTRTLNRGLRLSSCEFIARQDADDLSYPDRLSRQVAFLHGHPEVALVGSQTRMLDQEGRPDWRIHDRSCSDASLRWEMLFDNGFTHSAVMFRKAVILDECGGYDESFILCQDYDLWSRVAGKHRIANLPQRLIGYRFHPFSRMSDRLQGVYAEENRRIIRRNMETVFGVGTLSDHEVQVAVQAKLGLDGELLLPYLALLRHSIERYQALYPDVARTADFRFAVARRYAWLLYKTWRRNASLVWWVLAEGMPHYPVLRVSLGWLARALAAVISKHIPAPVQ